MASVRSAMSYGPEENSMSNDKKPFMNALVGTTAVVPAMRPEAPELGIGLEPRKQIIRHRSNS